MPVGIWRHRVFVADVSVSLDAFRRHTLHPQNNIALKLCDSVTLW